MVDFTSDPRLQPDPKVEARRREIYDQRPTAVKLVEQAKQDAETEQAEDDKVMREIKLRINEFVLKLLTQRLATPAARKAAQAKRPAPKAPAPKRRVPPGMPEWQWPQQATGWYVDRNGKYIPRFD